MKIRNGRFTGLSILLICVLALGFTGCTPKVRAADLMENVTAQRVDGRETDEAFAASYADFACKLFKASQKETQNTLLSPLSVMLALAMTANGADAQTKTEMEAVLGGGLPLDALNEYLYTYVKNLPLNAGCKLQIANSIWFREDQKRLTVERDFLQKNADYYNAAAYLAPFDSQTVEDINNWVKTNTNGMIDEIIDGINDNTVLYLINALAFDARWQNVYTKNSVHEGTFTAADGSKRTVDMMASDECRYINDGRATGFIKDYQDAKYSFVALLPNEDVPLDDYIVSLTGESLLSAVRHAQNTAVSAQLPKFSYDDKTTMNDALSSLGMPTAFDGDAADFSRLGRSAAGNLYIGEVLHKTFISVDELGTKAGAVTKVEMNDTGALMDVRAVTLDRPFVYAVLDNALGLPVFIGAVRDIQK